MGRGTDRRMKKFIAQLKNFVERDGQTWLNPTVNENQQEMHWWRKEKTLVIYQEEDGSWWYISATDDERDIHELPFVPEQITNIWRWFYENTPT